MEQHGLIIVHTGNGKGKTTAALGLAMRAWGDGLRVLILQFIKGGWKYGELQAIETLAKADGRIRVEQCGLGFTRRHQQEGEENKHREAAAAALDKARRAITSGSWDLIVLDEINYAINLGLTKEEEMLRCEEKPPELHLVIDGTRGGAGFNRACADFVTEMRLNQASVSKGYWRAEGINS